MNVILTHPKHGTKVAICQPEIDHDLEHGWKRQDDVQMVPPITVNELAKKRGRPKKEK